MAESYPKNFRNVGLVGLLMPQLRDSRRLRFRDQFLTLMYAALN